MAANDSSMQASAKSTVHPDEIGLDAVTARHLLNALKDLRRGDFFVRMPAVSSHLGQELADAFNDVVGLNDMMGKELARIGRIVGKEGKLSQRARMGNVTGAWADGIDAVNDLISDMARPTSETARVIGAVAKGDLSQRMQLEIDGYPLEGEFLRNARVVNAMADQLTSFTTETIRVAREVGTEGKLGGQAKVEGVAGTWKDLTDSINLMAVNLRDQVRNIADVTTAVARGDLSKKITVDVKGEILELKDTINTMVDQLNSFASEVTRVAREVGTEGRLGGQANVQGADGIWEDLTDNVNSMAANLTNQVRRIADVVTAVANGDLKRKLAVEAKGEIAALADTINGMIDTLATFADQVTGVAREVGIEGKLGGQAEVPGAAGLWRDLTDNVNQLAANLTTQVRAIAEVATAVTKGDLTRSIAVEASGEVASLKDNINEMIRNLRETTLKNTEQDWLKTNVARFTKMLQGQRDLHTVSQLVLSELAPLVDAQHGVFYISRGDGEDAVLELQASYGYTRRPTVPTRFRVGESLVGQCAHEKKRLFLGRVPDDYIKVSSGLGSAAPRNIIVMPVLFEGDVKAVIELASFGRFSETHRSLLDQLTESIGIVLNTIEANMRTEHLLTQSQSLTTELQSQQQELKNTNDRLEQQAENLRKSEELLKAQQEELQTTNSELEEKARLLSEQKAQVEVKNREVELAKEALEEKAEQLALASKYKSEFLANMSHELRTPLNSLLILARLLSENSEDNLLPRQIEFAKTIHAAGSDLLALIEDILDLAKVESGTFTLEMGNERFSDMQEYAERSFRQVAQDKNLEFSVEVDPRLPATIRTDSKRLQQIFRNLLSNAFKFTEEGSVSLRMEPATDGWSPDNEALNKAGSVIAFAVTDTGIGIRPDKQKIIFEAFQQADGTTSRTYGGTGLGLSISREIARRLGGELTVASEPGKGSTFTLYLPSGESSGMPVGTGDRVKEEPAAATTGNMVAKPDVLEDRSDEAESLVADDRNAVVEEDRILLIVDSDPDFSSKLLNLARDVGFKGLIAHTGAAALSLCTRYQPAAMTLDIDLRDTNGWALLDMLKHDPEKQHIPVQIISHRKPVRRGSLNGAVGFIGKKATRPRIVAALNGLKAWSKEFQKRALVVENQDVQREHIVSLLSGGDVEVEGVASGEEALAALDQRDFHCVVVDLNLPDMEGMDLLKAIRGRSRTESLPIVAYTGEKLTGKRRSRLEGLADSVVIKNANSPHRLLKETALLLHVPMSKFVPDKQDMIRQVHKHDPLLAGKRALIVDDDIRNIFSLTCVLEDQNMEVVYAENGKDAIATLKKEPGIDLVLMDVMMPDMDGYATTRAIRRIDKFNDLPIIAITAKAMKGDREKCIEAGASDYVAKPIDVMQLLSVLRVWLNRKQS